MKNIFNLYKKEWLIFTKDKVAVSLTFLVPVVLIFIFGKVFGGGTGDSKIDLGFINMSNSLIGMKLEAALDTSKSFRLRKQYKNDDGVLVNYDTVTIQKDIKLGKFSSALIIPEDAYTDTSSSLRLKFYYDPKNEIEMGIVEGVLTQTIMSQVPEIFTQSMQRKSTEILGEKQGGIFNREIAGVVSRFFGIDSSEILNPDLNKGMNNGDDGNVNFFKDILKIEKEQLVGKEITNPMATRNVGGWAMMFLLFSITASSASLFEEKRSGVLLRLLNSPLTKTDILWSKYLFNMSMGIIQLTVLFIAGWLIFSINIFGNFFNLFMVVFASSTACTAFGMFLSSVSKTAGQASGWGMFLILSMSAVGGAWFPVSLMPAEIQIFSKFTIVYWAIEGFISVLWREMGFVEILPNLFILLGISMIVNVVSVMNFRRGAIFK